MNKQKIFWIGVENPMAELSVRNAKWLVIWFLAILCRLLREKIHKLVQACKHHANREVTNPNCGTLPKHKFYLQNCHLSFSFSRLVWRNFWTPGSPCIVVDIHCLQYPFLMDKIYSKGGCCFAVPWILYQVLRIKLSYVWLI